MWETEEMLKSLEKYKDKISENKYELIKKIIESAYESNEEEFVNIMEIDIKIDRNLIPYKEGSKDFNKAVKENINKIIDNEVLETLEEIVDYGNGIEMCPIKSKDFIVNNDNIFVKVMFEW